MAALEYRSLSVLLAIVLGAVVVGGVGCGTDPVAVSDTEPSTGSDTSPDTSSPTDTGAGDADAGGEAPEADAGGDSCTAAEETCNGVDDDCDGEVDENLTRKCSLQEGVCQGAAVNCKNGAFPNCGSSQYGGNYASEETASHCDMADNDCDGETDEKCGCQLGEEKSCGTSTGVCTTGTRKCQGETLEFGPCTDADGNPVTAPGDQMETCNGKDDDCDGEVDEGLGGGSCTNQSAEGICRPGTRQCNSGSLECISRKSPGQESCDGKDNDCDGAVDENLNQMCAKQEGVCAGSSVACTGGSFGSCAAGDYGSDYVPTETDKHCDGLDNDCDGKADEQCDCRDGDTQPCGSSTGQCQTGVQTCTNGTFGACKGATGPSRETCDNKDNDCDGRSDEDFRDKGRRCSNGTGACRNSGTMVCDPRGRGTICNAPVGRPSPEKCDNVDNDCDGRTDEDVKRTCGTSTGQCTTGYEYCSSGSWGSCSGQGPSKEVCDQKDNDCDGRVDEGAGSTYYYDEDGDGYGVSSNTVTGCLIPIDYVSRAGDCEPTNGSIHPGATETCDRIDQDCDGNIAEGSCPGSCTCDSNGVCSNGMKICPKR
jgi:hypothetical protein